MISYKEELKILNDKDGKYCPSIDGFKVRYSLFGENIDLLDQRIKHAVKVVISELVDSEDLSGLSVDYFPEWLQSEFTEELTEQEYKERLENWRNDPGFDAGEFNKWSYLDWLYWMEPENRYWRWNSSKLEKEKLIVSLEVEDWPVAIEALEWLFKRAGAKKIEYTLSPE